MKREALAKKLANLAVQSLLDEVNLTPKPGLVDTQNNGSHTDLHLALMHASASSLYDTFYEMARLSYDAQPTVALRESFGAIGREGEAVMLQVTNGVNTHKGAIWSLGLLISAIARRKGRVRLVNVFNDAAELAKLPDCFIPKVQTNGLSIKERYGISGAREEAQQAFPHIRVLAYPIYVKALQSMDERRAKLYTLLSLIAYVNDTCIVHRGGLEGLHYAKKIAQQTLVNFTEHQLQMMDQQFQQRNLSPGGSADLLAATLFVYEFNQSVRGVRDGETNVYISS
ncbi:MAG: triphosphoribosyl-dephospho-CoA synthase [Solibacillus sp.]